MRRLVGLIAVALLTAACGSSGGTDKGGTVKSPAPSTNRKSTGTPALADALAFSLPGVTGPQIRGADYAGKSLALWFWAPW